MTTSPDQDPKFGEQLSAWLDDELPAAEIELLAARLARSPEHRTRAARYGLIGATLRGHQPGIPAASLVALKVSERVRAALDETKGQPGDRGIGIRPDARHGVARLLPYAVAASVALATLALVPLLGPGSSPLPDTQVARPTTPAALAGVQGVATDALPQSRVSGRVGGSGQASLSPGRLTNYLVYHGEYSGTLSTKLTDSHIVNNRAYAVALQPVAVQPAR